MYARSIAIVLSLVCACVLPACSPSLTRPVVVPTPPLVQCHIDPMPPIPAIPELSGMDAWAVTVLGMIESQAIKINAHNACMQSLRTRGVIR